MFQNMLQQMIELLFLVIIVLIAKYVRGVMTNKMCTLFWHFLDSNKFYVVILLSRLILCFL